MEINIIIGLYGSGKTTLLNKINNNDFEKLSLDDIDFKSRSDEKRIEIIY